MGVFFALTIVGIWWMISKTLNNRAAIDLSAKDGSFSALPFLLRVLKGNSGNDFLRYVAQSFRH